MSEKITLWSLQPYTVWEILQMQQTLRVDETLASYAACWPDSYEWMKNQMQKRVAGYEDTLPWWAWYVPKPDLRRWRHGFGEPGERFVRLELNLRRDNVVLSDRATWDYVLMHSYVPYNHCDDDEWEEKLKRSGINGNPYPLPEPLQTELEASWERIFELPHLPGGNHAGQARIQATFEVLRLSDVRDVTLFTST